MGKLKDETGNIYGNLKVLERDSETAHTKPYWKCECLLCGSIISVYGTNLRNGKTTMCKTCAYKLRSKNQYKTLYDSIRGKHFHHLTVIDEDTSKVGGAGQAKYWLCQYDCGNQISLSTHNIIHENMYSCGCMQRSKGEETIANLLAKNNIPFEEQKCLMIVVFH